MIEQLEGLRRRREGEYTATCPQCGHKRALSVKERNGEILEAYCHAQCGKVELDGAPATAAKRTHVSDLRSHHHGDHAAWIHELWSLAQPVEGTPAEAYLRSRGIIAQIPATIRYLPNHKHVESGKRWPTMIAAVTLWPSREPVALHRTYLTRDGAKAQVEPQRKTFGPLKGGAVRLGPVGNTLIVGEGIESTLSAMQLLGKPGWAALSTGGLERLKLPEQSFCIWIAADHDDPGFGAAHRASSRWRREGRDVRILAPPKKGSDFNDHVMASRA